MNPMTPDRYRQIGEIFRAARALPGDRRADYLESACGEDHNLLRDVNSLLAHESEGSSWIDGRALDLAAKTLAETQSGAWQNRRVSHYEVLSLLGAGGMGEVYRARDTRLDRDVAIKALPAVYSTNVEWLRRFEREARAAGRLNHPNVLTVFDVGIHEGRPYIVSELLEGESLRAVLQRGPLPRRLALDIGHQVAGGLAAAHAKDIVHRDLKPENLFVTRDGRVKILDFGLAKLQDRVVTDKAAAEKGQEVLHTLPGVVMGTVGYMSPEQVRGEQADSRSDIFVVGVMLHEMLSGARPFQGDTTTEVLYGILKADPPDLGELKPPIPPALSRLVHRCLEKTPERRFQSASDLSFALEALSLPSNAPAETAEQAAKPVLAERRFSRREILAGALGGTVGVVALYGFLSRRRDDPLEYLLGDEGPRQLTNFSGDEWGAEISRDGTFVCFFDRETPVAPWDVWITPLGRGGGTFRNLTLGAAPSLGNPRIRNTRFSPDNQIVMEVKEPSGDINLWAVSAIGGDFKRYKEKANEIDFSPDGRRMVYHDGGPGDPMFLAATGDREGIPLHKASEPGVHCHYPVWSPDDRYIYFVQGFPPDNMDIWRISVNGGAPERVTNHNSLVAYPTFLNDRILIYSALAPDGSGPYLYGFDLERGAGRRLTWGVEQYTSVSASHDGRRLVATRAAPEVSLWRMRMPEVKGVATDALPISLKTAQGLSPRQARDYLVYLASRDGDHGIWKLAADGTTTELWNGVDGRVLAGAAISPDGSRIAFASQKDGKMVLNSVSAVDGSGFLPLGDSVEVRGAPAWSPDGRWVAVAVDQGAGPRLAKVPVDGGPIVPLVKTYSINPVWDPGGRFLVYEGPHQGTEFPLLAVTADGEPYPLPEIRLNLGSSRFTFVPKTSLLVILEGGLWDKNLATVDLQTKQKRPLTDFSRDSVIKDFDISPDGQSIVFSRQRENANVVLINRPPARS